MDNILYKNKYRIKSTRLKHWDYSSNGTYYITICTKNRKCILGNVVNGKMELSKMGEIIKKCWYEMPLHFENIVLDEFIIMPNHLHGIIIIETVKQNVETPHWGVSTPHMRNPHHKPQWKPNSLGSIINQFKSIATKQIRLIGYKQFGWQSRFYEHIIRNETELNRIQKYIINNPLKWELDRENL